MVYDRLAANRLIPVLVLNDARVAPRLGRALVDGGLRCVEVTLRTPAALEGIRLLANETDLMVGVGTVTQPVQVDQAIEAGAQFVVSPGFSPAVVRHCRKVGVTILPGIATATELMAAQAEGIDVMKFFPAELLGGAGTVRALAGPFPTARFIPTGGITEANLPQYLALDSVLAVGGSWMVAPAIVTAADWPEVTRRTRAAVDAIQGLRP